LSDEVPIERQQSDGGRNRCMGPGTSDERFEKFEHMASDC